MPSENGLLESDDAQAISVVGDRRPLMSFQLSAPHPPRIYSL
jgi:hypothetical protein